MVAIAAGMLLVSSLHGNQAAAGTPVIVAFGDSLTAGFGLPQNEAFPAQLEKALKARYAAFNKEQGLTLKSRHYMNKAHYIDPRTPFVQRLLGIYNSVTGSM